MGRQAAVGHSLAVACGTFVVTMLLRTLELSPESAEEAVPSVSLQLASTARGLDRDMHWVEAWLGTYQHTHTHLDRPAFAKAGDASKLLFFTNHGYWHFGHPHDVERGAAMIAAQDDIHSPDLVSSAWRAIGPAGKWAEVRGLSVSPALSLIHI